jgi:hypothetical protein
VTSLTLSVGAATAVFSFFDVLLLRPLPIRAPHELYAVGPATGANPDLNPRYFSLEFYQQLTDLDPTFRDLFASSTVVSSGVHLSVVGSAARIRAELVSGNYFRVLGISARLGRTISEDDDRPRGAKYLNLREEPRRIVYRPHAQAFHSLMMLHVRAVGDPSDLVPIVRQEARALDPALPVFNVQTMRGRIDESLSQERLVATLAGALGLLGTLLAVVGVYGVVSYGVTRRKRELAIRVAVGGVPAPGGMVRPQPLAADCG